MLSGLETGIGLDIVIALQSTQNPVFDLLAQGLYHIGVNLLLLIILPLIYWSIDQPLGGKLLVAMAFAALLNAFLKDIFQTPRPFQVSPEVTPLLENSGFGFPSGHVMVTVVVWGYVAIVARRRWVTVSVIVYILLMMWSRMYMGAHYPQDVIGGVIFGLMTLWLFRRMIHALPVGWWDRIDLPAQIALVVLVIIFAAVFTLDTNTGEVIVGVIAGIGAGVIVMDRLRFAFAVPPDVPRKLLVGMIGVVLTVLIFGLVDVAFDSLATAGTFTATVLRILKYTLLAFIITTAYPLVAVRLGLLQQKQPQFL